MISDRKWAGVARCLVEMLTAGSANIKFAITAPPMHPATCTGRYAAASHQDSPPNAASTKDTTGLKWPPETGPNIKMIANSPAAVAAAFSSSSSPVSPGDSRCAAIPEPITTAARNALPSNSASSRRHSCTSATCGSGHVQQTPACDGSLACCPPQHCGACPAWPASSVVSTVRQLWPPSSPQKVGLSSRTV